MTRLDHVSRRLIPLAAALAAAAMLAGCTASATDETPLPAPAATTATGFTCPQAAQLSSLGALPFDSLSIRGESCTYTSSSDQNPASVTIVHGADGSVAGVSQLQDARKIQVADGGRVRDADRFSDDAFYVAPSSSACSLWVYAADGVISRVSVEYMPDGAVSACSLARITATLMGTAARASAPAVDLIAPAGLLDSEDVADLGRRAGVQIRVLEDTGAGYLPEAGAADFQTAAEDADPLAAAVVFVSNDTAPANGRLSFLRAATRAFSAARSAAPRARLVVVGPLTTGDTAESDGSSTRDALRSAAAIAQAVYIDPTTRASGTPVHTARGQSTVALRDLEEALGSRVIGGPTDD